MQTRSDQAGEGTGEPAGEAVASIRPHLLFAFLFTGMVNVLFLASPLYMMQLYGRVLNSRSLETLVSLSIALVLALVLMGAADAARGRLLARAGNRVAQGLAAPAARASLAEGRGRVGRALADVEVLRRFLGGGAAATLMDTPFTLLFLFLLFLLHPMLGLVATAGALAILAVTSFGRLAERRREQRIAERCRGVEQAVAALAIDRGDAGALGVADGLARRLSAEQNGIDALRGAAGDLVASVGATARTLRLAAHGAALACGAALAIAGELLPSTMLAAAILAGRALGPVEALPGALRQARTARTALASIEDHLQRRRPSATVVASATGAGVDVRRLVVVPAGATRPVLRSLSFRVEPGEMVSIAGPSGAGKTTLLRCLAGAEPIRSGEVRIGGIDVAAERRSVRIGWLPQDAPLYFGSIRDNIACFGDADDAAVLRAAERAGVRDAVERLPHGFATEVGVAGTAVSPSLRQAIAFARALLHDPALVLLDQPTAHMDAAGEVAALNAIRTLRAEGVTVIVVSHKPVLATLASRIMLIGDGAIEVYEERDKVMTALRRQSLRPVAETGGGAG